MTNSGRMGAGSRPMGGCLFEEATPSVRSGRLVRLVFADAASSSEDAIMRGDPA